MDSRTRKFMIVSVEGSTQMFSDPTDENVNILSYVLSLCQKNKTKQKRKHKEIFKQPH